ncbi:MAG: hypothetical protein SPJ37_03740, partial [Sodaliphilus sp.]|nr:hypothetical protein [Sodaliphilus sp.]
ANCGSHVVACNGFSQVFSAGKKEEFLQKSTFFSPLRWRLSIFGQINIGWIPCLGFSFFLCHFGVNYLRPHFATALGLLVWFWFLG